MTYEQLKNTFPEGISPKVKKTKPIGPKNALCFFVVLMLIFAVIGSVIQFALGMVGVMITELFFLVASIIYVKRKGHRLKDVFPVKKPKITAIIGTVIIWIGAYFAMIVSNLLLQVLFPGFPVSSDSDTIMSADLNWFFLFFIVAILPPICEEAMHRGVIQYGLKKKIDNPWIMALIIGLIFGIFHLDLSKFVATGLLGGVMGWILFKTDNMVYSSLFHFIHNGFQMVLMLFIPAVAVIPGACINTRIAREMLLNSGIISNPWVDNRTLPVVFQPLAANSMDFLDSSAGLAISAGLVTAFLGCIIPFIMYLGNYLLVKDIAPKRQSLFSDDKKLRKKIIRRLVFSSLCIVLIGILTVLYGFFLAL